MTAKRFYVDKSGDFRDTKTGSIIVDFGYSFNGMECRMILDLLNSLNDENEQLKKDVDYWKLASQYSNELNVFEYCKKYKTECKDIYWSSD